MVIFFFFKQKTAYEMRISDWSSDVCSSDLRLYQRLPHRPPVAGRQAVRDRRRHQRNQRSEERRVGKSVSVRVDLGGRRIIKKKKQTRTTTNHQSKHNMHSSATLPYHNNIQETAYH